MRYLLFAIALVPLFPSIASAQDWQDWSRQNPTYGSPAPEVAPAPSTTRPAPVVPGRPPVRTSPGQPVLSTRNPEFVSEFMRGCMANAGSHQKAYCACAVQKVQENFTFQQVMQMSEDYQRTGTLPTAMAEKAMRPCFGHIVR